MTQYRLSVYIVPDSKHLDDINSSQRTYTGEVLLLRIKQLLKNEKVIRFTVTRLPRGPHES
jgi:hypothetical protein